MVRHPHRLGTRHQLRELLQMPAVNAAGRAQRQTDAVQADSIVIARLAQRRERGAACAEKIFGMNFNEIECGLRLQQPGIVRMTPADAGRRNQSAA